MPKFRYKTNRGTFEIDSNRPLTAPELQDFVSKQTPISPHRVYPGATGISKAPPRMQQAAPAIGQFLGGVGGFLAGARVGHPYPASAIGGSLGRGAAILGARWPESVRQRPIRGLEAALPGLPFIMEYRRLSPELKQRFHTHMFKTAAMETATAGLAAGVTGLGRRFGMSLGREIFGARPAQRATERGWGNILRFKPGQASPQWIQKKAAQFFPRLRQVTGKQIDLLMKTKYRKVAHPLIQLKNKITGIVPAGLKKDIFQYIDDLAPDVSKNQKQLLKGQIDKILKLKGKTISLSQIWELRKELDDVLFRHRWHPEADTVFKQVRSALNEPLRQHPDLAFAFDKYAFVMEGKGKIKNAFEVIKAPEGEVYATELERYTKGAFVSEQKDILTDMLQKLDSYLKPDDRVINDLIDMAMAETMEQKLIPLGITGKVVSGALGGRRGVARAAQFGQGRVRWLPRAVGRAIPTAATEFSPFGRFPQQTRPTR